MIVKTVKELKEFLQTVPDDTPLAFYNYDDRGFILNVNVNHESVWADDRGDEGGKRDYVTFDDSTYAECWR